MGFWNSELWKPGSDGPSLQHSLKALIKMVHYLYSKFILEKVYHIKIPINQHYFEPDYSDLYNIFSIVMKRKPKISLEVGSGYSTYVISEALKILRKKDGISRELYCLEQKEKYLKVVKNYQNLGSSNFIKFIKISLKTNNYLGKKISTCSNFPNSEINFFYEDRTDHKDTSIAGDALLIEEKMPEDYAICIDGMIDTVGFYKSNLKRKYKISGRGFHGVNFIPSH